MAESDSPAAVWEKCNLAPVEIALPGGKVGLTVRGYRAGGKITMTDVSERETDDELFSARDRRTPLDDGELPEFEWTEEQLDAIAAAPAEDAVAEAAVESEEAEEEPAEEDEAAGPAVPDEVPVFLSHKGRLLLFQSPQGLIDFVKSGAPHDLTQLPEWKALRKELRAADMSVAEEDSYELDLVVDNLRGGPDAWDSPLILRAGEIARDLGYALQLPRVMSLLAPGSPLDNLDDTLRDAEAGGMTGFRARRRLRRFGADQASLGWRTIIGNIAAAVDWRD